MARILQVTPQGYHKWIKSPDKPYKHAVLLGLMQAIIDEDEENKEYGIKRMFEALAYKHAYTGSLSTVARVMRENNLIHQVKRKPNGLTKAYKEANKSDDLLKRDFTSDEPNKKCVRACPKSH